MEAGGVDACPLKAVRGTAMARHVRLITSNLAPFDDAYYPRVVMVNKAILRSRWRNWDDG
uniref:Uncharacterized protein n=1 Tax=Oryza rufipogon TaxID=4529 RepID=A0A0E0PZB8_ORYRU